MKLRNNIIRIESIIQREPRLAVTGGDNMIAIRMTREDEVVLISDYGFEWYKDGELIKEGLVENLEEDLESLKNEGFN